MYLLNRFLSCLDFVSWRHVILLKLFVIFRMSFQPQFFMTTQKKAKSSVSWLQTSFLVKIRNKNEWSQIQNRSHHPVMGLLDELSFMILWSRSSRSIWLNREETLLILLRSSFASTADWPSRTTEINGNEKRQSRGPDLESPEKPFVKLRSDYSEKLVFSYVVKGMRIQITAKFRASRRLLFEDTKRMTTPECARKVSGLSRNGPQMTLNLRLSYIFRYAWLFLRRTEW